MTSEYAGECAKPLQAFGERFQDVKSKQKGRKIFATLFNVEPADVPDNLQHKIIELRSHGELPLLEFYKLHVCPENFFYSEETFTDVCIPVWDNLLISKPTLARTRFRSRLTDSNMENQLRVASSLSLPSDIRCLAKEKQFQPSHY